MALEGSLRDFDLFSLFNMIKIQGKNGTLVLSKGQEFVKVFFENGEIVGCDSNQIRMEDRVGTMLVRLGRLTGEELLEMIQLQRQTLKRMGTLLLESGKVTPQDLQDALFQQATAILHRTFRWVEGDYRFDSMLPTDLDREHFQPIPVDTVLMEAARIQDEWPEVEKRLPSLAAPLAQTTQARNLHLDIHREISDIFEGGPAASGSSGLTHEQEMVLSYFDQAQSIQEVIQISRYEELDTCKCIADLVEQGLLKPAVLDTPKVARPWIGDVPTAEMVPEPEAASPWIWPTVALLLVGPLILGYVPAGRDSHNPGLASLQPVDVWVVPEGGTRIHLDWAYRMAAPKDGGLALSRRLGRPMAKNGVPDLTKSPDPMAHPAPPPPVQKDASSAR